MSRELRFHEAIQEALDLCLAEDPSVYLMGLGVPDPKGTFGTTLGLAQKHGPDRVLDMPTSEGGMTGVAIGSALVGMRPVMSHQRVEFALLAVEQLVNQAAKWHYMFGGQMRVPLVVRMIVGRGWGQGPQHSQSLHSWFAHIPGLKVAMPTTPHDAKGLLIRSIEDDNPVVFLEHRWLHNIRGPVPEGRYTVPLGEARVAREGRDLTIVALGYMTLEALRAADVLAEEGILVEVVDLRTLRPFDAATVLASVRKTGRLLVAEPGWSLAGFGAEVVAQAAEHLHGHLKAPPRRVAHPDAPLPTSPALSRLYYPRALDLLREARSIVSARERPPPDALAQPAHPLDVPDPTFTGPF